MTNSLTTSTALAAVLGLGVGVGLLLMITGWRGVDPDRPRRLDWRRSEERGDQRVVLQMVTSVAVGVTAGVITGWVVGAVLAGAACWTLPRVLGHDRAHSRRVARIEAIATWTEMLRDTLSAAAGLEQAILATAGLAPPAIREEITILAARLEGGDRLAPSLRQLAEQLGDPTGDLVIASLVLAAEYQARHLGDLLGSLAQAAREQATMRLRVAAGRSRTRTSVRVIVGTTLGFAAVVVVVDRSYLVAYDSAFGQLMLLVVGGLFAAGVAWLARMSRVAEPDRFLVLSPPVEDISWRDKDSADSGKAGVVR
jgi:tight adherence protein B